MKITEIQILDSDDESQLSLRPIEPEISGAKNVRSELEGPTSQPQLQRSFSTLSNVLS